MILYSWASPKLRPISYKDLCHVFEREGFHCAGQEGDHLVFTKPGVNRPVVILKYGAIPFRCSAPILSRPAPRPYECPIEIDTLRRAMARDHKPVQVICLDHAFEGNGQLKTNIVLEMEAQNIQFRTV